MRLVVEPDQRSGWRADDSNAETRVASPRRALTMGIGGAVLTFVSQALLLVVVYPVFLSSDESHHVDHAWRVGHGELPKFEDGVGPERGLPASSVQLTFQHPPLFYLLTAPVITPLLDAGRWRAATLAGRLAVAFIGTVSILAVAWATHRVVRRPDPMLVVGAAMVAAVVNPFVGVSASFYNDALAVLAATIALGLAATLLRRGPTAAAFVALTTVSTAGLATRASFASIMIVVALAAGVALARARPMAGVVERALAGVGGAVVVLAAPLLISAWFYERNRRLTGNWVGAVPGFAEVLGRATRPLIDVVLDVDVWRSGVAALIVQPTTPDERSFLLWTLPLIAVVVVAALAGGRCLRCISRRNLEPTDLLVGMLLVAAAAGTIGEYLIHVASGGGQNPRYLLPALLPICLAAAYGLRGGRRTRGVLLVGFTTACAVLLLDQTVRILHDRRFAEADVWEAWRSGAELNGLPGVLPLLLVGVLPVGIALGAGALWRLTDERPTPGRESHTSSLAPDRGRCRAAARSAVRRHN